MTPAETLAAKLAKPPRTPRTPRLLSVWQCEVRALRKALGLTLEEAAAAIGISAGHMSNVERGVEVTLATAMKFARFFGKSIEQLWREKA